MFLPTRICEEISRYLPENEQELLDGFIAWGSISRTFKDLSNKLLES